VDVTQLQFVPTALELFEFSESPPSTSRRSVRIALVVRPDQARHGRLVEKVARNKGVLLTCFDGVENATAWVKPMNPAHDEDEPSTEYCEFQARGG
jgi:hypothetical protein